jgi:hypothetical protein
MIHRRKIKESLSIGELFQKNRVGENEDTLFNVEYELKIRTPYGYHKVPTLVRTIKQTAIRLYFTNNKTIECGWEHKLKVNGEWKQVKDINIETDYIETDNGLTKIRRIYEGKEKILYDLSVDKVHCFYGNGILSHNTWALCALGAAAVKAGKTVVHYSMELSEKYVGNRYDTVFTQISSADLSDKKDEVKDKIHKLKGKLLIKYFPPKGVSVKKLESHIEKMTSTGHKPDLIIVDYADLLLSHTNKSDSTYAEQGGVYIELRGMSGELSIPIWTASQTNRTGIDAEVIEADKIADSYAKVMNADFIMSLSRKSKDKLNNTARVHVMKNRFGPDGITFPSKMDTNRGILEIYTSTSSDGIVAAKESKNGEVMEKQLLHKKYLENMDMG